MQTHRYGSFVKRFRFRYNFSYGVNELDVDLAFQVPGMAFFLYHKPRSLVSVPDNVARIVQPSVNVEWKDGKLRSLHSSRFEVGNFDVSHFEWDEVSRSSLDDARMSNGLGCLEIMRISSEFHQIDVSSRSKLHQIPRLSSSTGPYQQAGPGFGEFCPAY